MDVLTLPNGLRFYYRPDTSDANSAIACAAGDEYNLASYDLVGKTVFDIGGHVGGVSLLAAALGARVVCVEPVPENAEMIRRSAELNGLEVEVVEGAFGTDTVSYGWTGEGLWGELTGAVHSFVGNTGHGLEREGYVPAHTQSVPQLTLASLVAHYGAPYLAKLDCEGGEWAFLAEREAADIPVIVGEYHGWEGSSVGAEEHFDSLNRLHALLDASHDVQFPFPEEQVGNAAGHFVALRRA